MRIASLLAAGLCACGVNQDAHQKALDDARLKGEELGVARGELETVHHDLDAARNQLQAAQKDVAALRKKARGADALRLVNLAALRLREAQVLALAKTAEKAQGSLSVAAALLGKLRDEPSFEDAPDVGRFVEKDLAGVLDLLAQARSGLATPKTQAAGLQALADAVTRVESALAAQPAALEAGF